MNRALVLLAVLAVGAVGCDRYAIVECDRYEIIAQEAGFVYRLDKRTGEVCSLVPHAQGIRLLGCAGAKQ
jgi:hypothetical protein